RTDPLNPDTDDDGLLDGQEDINFNGRVDRCERDPETDIKLDSDCLDEFNPNDGDDVKADSDGDGLNDKEEREVYKTDPDVADTDKDGLLDGQEVKVHLTDPNVIDTDQGGVGDGDEVENGTNPLKPEDDFSLGKLSGSGESDCAATPESNGGGTPIALVVIAAFGLLAWRRRRTAVMLLAACAVFAAPTAEGQTTASAGTGLSALSYHGQGGHYRVWSVEQSRVSPHLIPYGSAMFLVETEALRLVTGNATETLVEYAAYVDINLGIGLYDWVQVELDLPIALAASSGDDVKSIAPVGGAGIGDLVFRARTRLLDNTAGGFGIGFAAGVTFPTGDAESFRGDPGFGVLLNTVWDFRASRVVTALNVGFHLRTEAIKFFDSTIEHEMTYGVGVDVVLWRNHVNFGAELTGRTDLSAPFSDKDSTSLELMAGPKVAIIEGLSFQAGFGGGIMRGAGTPSLRALAGFAWAPRVQDSDGDGIAEADDFCPLDKEDKDDYRDGDGCPDLDNDGDGVADLVDKCPMAPEDRNGIEDTDGCPDEDQDHDQIIDLVDRCPYEPEDHDGFQDHDGCPEADNDNDGIPDIYDECPNRAETYNRFKNEDGCPDMPACLMRLTNLIYFEEGKAELDRDDQAELKLIADQIVDNELIDKITIVGHAFQEAGVSSGGPDSGSAATDRTSRNPERDRRLREQGNAVLTELGRRRAEAVREYLLHWQVPADILAMQAVGDTEPLKIDRPGVDVMPRRNRRVSFRIEMDSRCQVFQGGRVEPPR
ncbi:MAG: MYXO-CTERM domain-containing protein, partial [Myxococcota bacterium]